MSENKIWVDKDQHIWIRKEDDIYEFGITDFAQDQLGEILYVELPDTDSYDVEDYLMSLESDKKDQELFAPCHLTVVEINEDLDDSPELINEDAMENWIFKAQLDEDELEHLSTLEDYLTYVDNQNEA